MHVVALLDQQSGCYCAVHAATHGDDDFCHTFSGANYRGFQAVVLPDHSLPRICPASSMYLSD